MNYSVIESIKDIGPFMKDLVNSPELGLDVETSSLDPLSCILYSVQISTRNHTYLFDAFKFKELTYLVQLIETKTLIGHNIKYDISVLYRYTGIVLRHLFDTQLAEVLIELDPRNRYPALDELVYNYFGVKLDKEVRKSFYENGILTELTQQQIIYAVEDVQYLHQLKDIQYAEILRSKQDKVWKIECDLESVTMKSEMKGVKLDMTAWTKLMLDAQDESKETKEKILDLIVERTKDLKFDNLLTLSEFFQIKETEVNGKIVKLNTKRMSNALEQVTDDSALRRWLKANLNLGSHAQLKKTLNTIGFPVESTSEEVLKDLNTDDEVITSILTYRGLDTLSGTFGQSFLDAVSPVDGRLHYTLNQLGARSGRYSGEKPNIQNIPKDNRYRACFIAEKGYKFICLDFNQEEYRLAGAVTGEPAIIQAYLDGYDMHLMTASSVYGINIKDVTKEQRSKGKAVNFACVPLDTEILSKSGWKKHNQVAIGDEVLGYNQIDDRMEWTMVDEVVHYDSAPLIEMKHNTFKFISTPNHRWYGDTRIKRRNLADRYDTKILTTNEINSDFRIYTSAPIVETERILDISTDESFLIGMLYTDGSCKISKKCGKTSQGIDSRRRGVFGRVFQSIKHNPEKVQVLDKRLNGLYYRRDIKKNDIVWYNFRSKYLRELFARANLLDGGLETFVLSLNSEQRKSFLEAALLSEACLDKNGTVCFYQNEGETLDATKLAIFLEGYFPTHSDRIQYTGKNNVETKLSKRTRGCQTIIKTQIDDAPVWCVKTRLGTWVARQGKYMTITGNTIYGTTEYGLAYNFKISVEEGREILAKFRHTYPVFMEVKEMYEDAIVKAGYACTLTGRRRYFPRPTMFENGRGKGSYEQWVKMTKREGFNTIIQGTGGDVIKLSQVKIDYENPFGNELSILYPVHDEVVVEVNEKYGLDAYEFVKNCMLTEEQKFLGKIPAKVEGPESILVSHWEH